MGRVYLDYYIKKWVGLQQTLILNRKNIFRRRGGAAADGILPGITRPKWNKSQVIRIFWLTAIPFLCIITNACHEAADFILFSTAEGIVFPAVE